MPLFLLRHWFVGVVFKEERGTGFAAVPLWDATKGGLCLFFVLCRNFVHFEIFFLDGSFYLDRSLFLDGSCGSVLLCYNGEGHLSGNFLVELNGSHVFAGSLHVLDGDDSAVDVEAELLKLVGNLQVVHAAVDDTVAACLCADSQRDSVQLLSQSFGFSLDLGELDSLLLKLLGEHLLGTLAGDDALALRNQIVAAVAGLNIHNIVLVTETDYIFFINRTGEEFVFNNVSGYFFNFGRYEQFFGKYEDDTLIVPPYGYSIIKAKFTGKF